MKKIAVITPVFNGEKFITDCIKSVALSITGRDFIIEHIVVDDCSTDDTWNILQERKHPLVKAFHLKKQSGSSAARNFGIKQTEADFLFCLDHDDVIFQHSLKSLFEYAENHKTGWIYGDFVRTDETLTYLFGQDYYGYQFNSSAGLLTSIFSGEHFIQQNSIYRKSIFDHAGGFDESMKVCEDLDLFIRFALEGHCPHYLPGPLYLHRFHKDNMSRITGRENNLKIHKEDIKKLYAKYRISLEKMMILTAS